MPSHGGDYTEILIRKRIISAEQLADAKRLAKESGKKVADELVRLGYASGDDVMRAMAQEHGLDFVNLKEVAIPPSVVELVPESVARENAILPMSEENGSLKVIVSDPLDYDTREKLRFILNRNVEIALAPRESILEAINRHYGASDGESTDSMLQEFTDTAIDFTETAEESVSHRRSGRRFERPDRAAGAFADQRSGATAGVGHPYRAVRRPGADSLPDRRRADRAR